MSPPERKRSLKAKAPQIEPKPKPPAKPKRVAKEPPATALAVPTETAEEAMTHIAQDAVLILRRELAWRAEQSLSKPGQVSMGDCIALLRLAADLGATAMRGSDGAARADYSRLSPEERVQFAALLLKVDYA